MRKLRFAQAGVSLMHANMYRDTLMLLPDEIELVGFYDSDPQAARAHLKDDVASLPFYESLSDLIEQAKPDAIMVSAYPDIMPDWLLQIAAAGVHIWAEKPVAAHSRQLAPVAEAIASNRLHFSTGYSWRFHPISRLINTTYSDGLLGTPYSIDMRFSTSSVKRRGPNSWLFSREISGGGILNWLGCHWFDLMRFITGSEVVSVSSAKPISAAKPSMSKTRRSSRCSSPMVWSAACMRDTSRPEEATRRFESTGRKAGPSGKSPMKVAPSRATIPSGPRLRSASSVSPQPNIPAMVPKAGR